MALTAEQQFQLDLLNAQHANNKEIDALRSTQNTQAELVRLKLEAVRMAKEVLVENAKVKPVDQRQVTEQDIINFANALIAFTTN